MNSLPTNHGACVVVFKKTWIHRLFRRIFGYPCCVVCDRVLVDRAYLDFDHSVPTYWYTCTSGEGCNNGEAKKS